jgi:hypothetical protein
VEQETLKIKNYLTEPLMKLMKEAELQKSSTEPQEVQIHYPECMDEVTASLYMNNLLYGTPMDDEQAQSEIMKCLNSDQTWLWDFYRQVAEARNTCLKSPEKQELQ